MRNEFGKWIVEAAKKDSSVILLVGDIGFGIFDQFRQQYPERFINCGIAEQNMIGVAAGLAAQGFKPYVYTIIPFLIYRPFEFIRNLIAYQRLGVTLVGVGGGFSYDKLGFTHHAVEDIGLIMSLPFFKVYTPYDPSSSRACFESTLTSEDPSYIRLMKGGERDIPYLHSGVGYSILANRGTQYTIFVHGSLAEEAIKASDILEVQHAIKGKVIAIYSEKGWLNLPLLVDLGCIFLIEEHIAPGLFERLILRKSHNFNKNNIINLSIDPEISLLVGTRSEILKANKLDEKSIAIKVLEVIKQTYIK
jgi:transketolase